MVTELMNSKNWDLELVCATPVLMFSGNLYMSLSEFIAIVI